MNKENKGDSKKEMLERFKSMGVPTPVVPIKNQPLTTNNPEGADKLNQIRNGSMKDTYAKFIDKAEKTSAGPVTIPVPKVGKNPNEKAKNAPQLESFAPKSSSQASMIENMMFGDSSMPSTTYNSANSSSEVENFGPNNIDTRSRLRARLQEKQSEIQNNQQEYFDNNIGINLTEAELTDKITEICKNISKKMIKSVLLEFSKTSGGLIIENKKIKKAEIVGKNKVKIGGKIYKLTPEK